MPSRSASQQGRLNLVQGTPLGTRLLKSAISHVLLDHLSTPMGYLPDAAKKSPHLVTANPSFSAPQPEVPRHVVCPRWEAPLRPSALIRGRGGAKMMATRSVPSWCPPTARPKSNPDRRMPTLLTHPPLSCSGFLPSTPSFRLSSSLPPSSPPRPSTAEESGPTEFASTI